MTRIEELEAKRLKLVEKKMELAGQLADRNRTGADGGRMESREFWQWHKRCSYALRCTEVSLMKLNVELKKLKRAAQGQADSARGAIPLDPFDEKSLILNAYLVLHRLAKDVEIEPNEQAVINALRGFIHRGAALSNEASP